MSHENTAQAVIHECTRLALAGSIDFGSVVRRLIEVGVESYWVDYRRGETTYYLPADATFTLPLAGPDTAIADHFDAGAVQAAVRGAQSGKVHYPEFLQLTRQAGCVGYMVWISGRHVQYYGRRGEVHTEHFPPAP